MQKQRHIKNMDHYIDDLFIRFIAFMTFQFHVGGWKF